VYHDHWSNRLVNTDIRMIEYAAGKYGIKNKMSWMLPVARAICWVAGYAFPNGLSLCRQ